MIVRAGIVGSSGGSALSAAVHCARLAGIEVQLAVVVDRECGLARWARRERYPVAHISYTGAEHFSAHALSAFRETGQQQVLLFYTRRVASPLIDVCSVWNIHPSLLPSFPGLHGVRDALQAGAPFLGATLHQVDSGLDTGRIAAQVQCELPFGLPIARAGRLSYMQKVYLTLLWLDAQLFGFREPSCTPVMPMGAAITRTTNRLNNIALLDAYCDWASTINQEDSSTLAALR